MHSWDIMEFLKKQELSKAMAVWNLEPVENAFLKELPLALPISLYGNHSSPLLAK